MINVILMQFILILCVCMCYCFNSGFSSKVMCEISSTSVSTQSLIIFGESMLYIANGAIPLLPT